ncbi:MAG: phage portal protein [Proteobacteria bacterium]|nr:phage portal protein [Pseudomonadota bacterium]
MRAPALTRKRSLCMASALGRAMPSISRDAGRHRGTLSNYRPTRTTISHEAFERGTAQSRSEDLTANDWAAASVVDSMTVNTVGSGIKPQARVNWKRLGISQEAAKDLNEQMEWAWRLWSVEAHVSGKLHFDDLVFLGMRSLLRMGELVHLPLMLDDPSRTFSLAFQDVHPARLCTPSDRTMDPSLRDGVELSSIGRPLAYWIASPEPSRGVGLNQPFSLLGSAHFVRRPALTGHRPGVFHCFRAEEDEQVRGVPKLAPGMKLFRHLNDSFDYELMAQIVSASFPVFIATKDPQAVARQWAQPQPGEGEEDQRRYYQNLPPGTVAYGNPGEEPIPIESKRPGNNFTSFAELIMRSMAASVGMPYEVLAKDFSKTNYSSARAALLEAWRIFLLYRTWLVRHYCQPIWNMVQEEAWLRGIITLPKGAPDFYDAQYAYTNAAWIGPARGYVDPVKEVVASTKALEARLTTYADVIAERGGDIEEVWNQREVEEARLRELGPQQQQQEIADV